MKANELRSKYLEFFKSHGHAIIPSASLVPENDPTILFTPAGMSPLIPYILGQPHPLGKRLADTQKCIRVNDIEEVGDASHLPFFEMLGNWSLGDYFKEESISMSFEFLTSKKWLGIPVEKISVTCFAGDADAPKDEESAKVWESLGIPKERIFSNGKEDNWWAPPGQTGPCGPDTEIFYDTGKEKCLNNCRPGCHCGKYVELWNNVFMEFFKTKEGTYEKLKQQNVDTGMGLDRATAMLQGKSSVFDTEMFMPAIEKIKTLSANYNDRSSKIIADHMRAATFILGDTHAITPSNVEQGYILRRLIRRAIRHGRVMGIQGLFCSKIAEEFVKINSEFWPELKKNEQFIVDQLNKEEERFNSTIEHGLHAFEKIFAKSPSISGEDAFLLFQSYGFPLEMTVELANEKKGTVDAKGFEAEFEKHQETSRVGAEKKFKSGLADSSEKTTQLHTATHLLHAALKLVLGPNANQKGSNITPERLRFDFTHPEKMTPEQIKKVEDLVNEQIQKGLAVTREEMSLEEAQKKGATALFTDKYDKAKVSVYSVGDFSKEVCTGPHVENTSQLGRFKIQKEEAVSAGVRRIKAVLE